MLLCDVCHMFQCSSATASITSRNLSGMLQAPWLTRVSTFDHNESICIQQGTSVLQHVEAPPRQMDSIQDVLQSAGQQPPHVDGLCAHAGLCSRYQPAS